jgi:hypothetical protein
MIAFIEYQSSMNNNKQQVNFKMKIFWRLKRTFKTQNKIKNTNYYQKVYPNIIFWEIIILLNISKITVYLLNKLDN